MQAIFVVVGIAFITILLVFYYCAAVVSGNSDSPNKTCFEETNTAKFVMKPIDIYKLDIDEFRRRYAIAEAENNEREMELIWAELNEWVVDSKK
ncbi:hypothetical protein EQG49_04095 [Periweissella cryptocerci]|uniref:Uncharacterized protein n=1 Tax=Periweissella cryptocerci TaxID=2506420 RepID=A0A4P6YSK9_9LACO|nr:hypothetical protein [Periweissella cryptocerci]QBO35698.1 hypothetical protein EQG49_04095 [Periweissella cryptocerci]